LCASLHRDYHIPAPRDTVQTPRLRLAVPAMLALIPATTMPGAAFFSQFVAAQEQRAQSAVSRPSAKIVGTLELVTTFTGAMPTGITVATDGRIFVNFPRWGDPVPFTVAEMKDGQPIAYPNADITQLDTARAREMLVSVQSVVVDRRHRLWILDTGGIKFAPVVPKGPKLVGIDLATDRIIKIVQFPPDVVLPTTYPNDIHFDLRKGEDGVAYITDSSDKGPNTASLSSTWPLGTVAAACTPIHRRKPSRTSCRSSKASRSCSSSLGGRRSTSGLARTASPSARTAHACTTARSPVGAVQRAHRHTRERGYDRRIRRGDGPRRRHEAVLRRLRVGCTGGRRRDRLRAQRHRPLRHGRPVRYDCA
jgi:hypothetical protein